MLCVALKKLAFCQISYFNLGKGQYCVTTCMSFYMTMVICAAKGSGLAERFSKWGGTVAEYFFWGGAQSLRGSVATEGQGRRSIFRIGGGGKSYKKLKIVCAKFAIYIYARAF